LPVEDEDAVASALSELLSDFGFEVIGPVATGREALKVLETEEVDVVLLDIGLPDGMDGIEAARRVQVRHPGMPVIFVTGRSDQNTISRALLVRPAGFLTKPYQPQQLKDALTAALRGGVRGEA
jgi:DNA-binding NarL/FixJ family response regulator